MNTQILPAQLIQFIKQSMNPSQVIINMMEERVKENPLYANLLELARNNQTQEIEGVVRNIFKEKGYDYDKEFNNFKHNLGF